MTFKTPYEEYNIAARGKEISEKCQANGWNVDAPLVESLLIYQDLGVRLGDFMMGILTNDLARAVNHADNMNRYRIADIYCCIQNHLPHDCHGSKKAVEDWINRHVKGVKDEFA